MDANGMRLAKAAADSLLQEMADLYVSFCALMIRRASGDYRKDKLVDLFPEWETPGKSPFKEATGPSITEIFDGYAAERQPSAATVKAWKRMMGHLEAFLNNKPAPQVDDEDILAWKDRLLAALAAALSIGEELRLD